jgi:hypothetical protein
MAAAVKAIQKGLEADRAGVGGGRGHARVAGRKAPRAFSYVDETASAPDLHPERRDRHGVTDDSIGLETTTMLY